VSINGLEKSGYQHHPAQQLAIQRHPIEPGPGVKDFQKLIAVRKKGGNGLDCRSQ
jgi:hypothetical protein